jgi:hypothetical protein
VSSGGADALEQLLVGERLGGVGDRGAVAIDVGAVVEKEGEAHRRPPCVTTSRSAAVAVGVRGGG